MKLIHYIRNYKTTSTAFLFCLLCMGSGCRKFIEVDPPVTSVTGGSVYQNDNTAVAVLTELYTNFMLRTVNSSSIDDGVAAVCWVTELTGDNLTLEYQSNQKLLNYYQNNLESTGNIVAGTVFWSRLYEYIYKANAAMEGISGSAALSTPVKTQLLGECYFLRAFCYFYLVNLYGDAALVLTTDYASNSLLPRVAASDIYRQIVADLTQAKTLLKEQYVGLDMITASTERIRVNKAAAQALLARVYLYTGEYAKAETEASGVIGNSLYSLITDNPGSVFLKNSKETIWAMQPTLSTTQNTWESVIFPLTKIPNASNPVSLSASLIATFDTTKDKRYKNWIGTFASGGKTYYYAYKYKAGSVTSSITEYEMVLRLAEQYLIRAEARTQQGNITGAGSAATDLNTIRNRAGLADTTVAGKEEMVKAILLERRKEFFTEWGHRWFDLKRLAQTDAVMLNYAPLKGGTWQSYKALFPIAQTEIALNPGMTGQQNEGYN